MTHRAETMELAFMANSRTLANVKLATQAKTAKLILTNALRGHVKMVATAQT